MASIRAEGSIQKKKANFFIFLNKYSSKGINELVEVVLYIIRILIKAVPLAVYRPDVKEVLQCNKGIPAARKKYEEKPIKQIKGR